MLVNYLKLALRQLIRNPFFTFINVLGLSVGFAVFFVLWQYSQSELKSDQFHKDWDKIYRFGFVWKWSHDNVNWNQDTSGYMLANLPPWIAGEFHEITSYVRVFKQENFTPEHIPQHGKEIFFTVVDRKGEKQSFLQDHVVYADANLFDFFELPLLKGNSQNILAMPYSVALSEKSAKKYFGDKDPVGQNIILNDSLALKVTGVFKNLRRNSHLDFEIVISTGGIKNNLDKVQATYLGPHCYFKIPNTTNVRLLENQLNQFKRKYFSQFIDHCNACDVQFYLQSLRDVPFSDFWNDWGHPKSKYILVILQLASVIILVMAWINYVNLTIAAYFRRIKELATRRTIGAMSIDLLKQFTTEAAVINIISFILAVTLVQLFRRPLEFLFQFYLPDLSEVPILSLMPFGCALLIGILITGILPVVLWKNKSAAELLSVGYFQQKRAGVPDTLTIMQLVFALVLIVWMSSIYLQLNYVLNKDGGINTEQVVIVDLPIKRQKEFQSRLSTFFEEVSKQPGIIDHTMGNSMMGDNGIQVIGLKRKGSGIRIGTDSNGGVDERFITFFGIKLIAGRNFLPDNPADHNSLLVNKGTVKRLGFDSPDQAVGEEVIAGKMAGDSSATCVIIGVIEDYTNYPVLQKFRAGHSMSLALTYQNFVLPKLFAKKAAIRISATRYQSTIAKIETIYKAVFHESLFHWYFLNDNINRHYTDEKIFRNQILLFTAISIGIACLGFLGMLSNRAKEKTKEVGIRKILGASSNDIAKVLLRTTWYQITVAVVIAVPVAYFIVQNYLQRYSERIILQWWHYALPVVILIAIMFVTVASMLLKAARNNPVKVLKCQ